ncbi:hypothetical protein [Streptomyces sp. NPDC008125]
MIHARHAVRHGSGSDDFLQRMAGHAVGVPGGGPPGGVLAPV